MLPRVSSALIKFITPIVAGLGNTSLGVLQHHPKDGKTPQKEHPQKNLNQNKRGSPKPPLKLVPTSGLASPTSDELTVRENAVSASSPLVQLLNLLRDQKSLSPQKNGVQIYLKTLSQQKHIGKSYKGVIVDENVE